MQQSPKNGSPTSPKEGEEEDKKKKRREKDDSGSDSDGGDKEKGSEEGEDGGKKKKAAKSPEEIAADRNKKRLEKLEAEKKKKEEEAAQALFIPSGRPEWQRPWRIEENTQYAFNDFRLPPEFARSPKSSTNALGSGGLGAGGRRPNQTILATSLPIRAPLDRIIVSESLQKKVDEVPFPERTIAGSEIADLIKRDGTDKFQDSLDYNVRLVYHYRNLHSIILKQEAEKRKLERARDKLSS